MLKCPASVLSSQTITLVMIMVISLIKQFSKTDKSSQGTRQQFSQYKGYYHRFMGCGSLFNGLRVPSHLDKTSADRNKWFQTNPHKKVDKCLIVISSNANKIHRLLHFVMCIFMFGCARLIVSPFFKRHCFMFKKNL